MSRRVYGIDLDGCLCNFARAYAALLTKHTGVVFPVDDPAFPPVWFWERMAGITKDQEKLVWAEIMSSDFWETLSAFPAAAPALKALYGLRTNGDYIYFITSRPGEYAKHLSEWWLDSRGYSCPTVLIAGNDKGPICKGLGLTHFVDDKPENCEAAAFAGVENVFLLDAPYNRPTTLQQDGKGEPFGDLYTYPNERYPNIVRIYTLLDSRVFPNILKLEQPEVQQAA